MDTAPPAVPATPEPRPKAPLVFGILSIVFAIFGGFALVVSMVALDSAALAESNPIVALQRGDGPYALFSKVATVVGVAGAAILLASGIGLLMMKVWARKLSVGYAVFTVVFGVIGLVFNLIYIVLPALSTRPESTEAAVAMGGAIGGFAGALIGLVFPVCIIFFLRRKPVVEAFGG